MELPPEARNDENAEERPPETQPSESLANMLSGLIEMAKFSPPVKAHSSEPVPEPENLDVDPESEEDLPEPTVLDEMLDQLIADPEQELEEEPELGAQAAEEAEPLSEEPSPELTEEPVSCEGAVPAEEMGEAIATPELVEAESAAAPVDEAVEEGFELAAESEVEAAIESAIENIDATVAERVPEPLFETAPEEAAEAVGEAGEPELAATEREWAAAPTEEAVAEEATATALDELVAEIDQQSRVTFEDDRSLVFESELPARQEVRGGESCIVFLLDGTRYAIPIRNVLEMDTIPRTTYVPNVPAFVRGVTNVRGEILSVLDLRSLFGMERAGSAESGRILIVRTADQHTAALTVDEVRGTASLALGELGAPTAEIHDKVMPVLLGVSEHQDQVLNVLDIDKVFQMQEIQQLTAN